MRRILTFVDSFDRNFSGFLASKSQLSPRYSYYLAKTGDNLPWMAFSLFCLYYNVIFPRVELLLILLATGVCALFNLPIKFSVKRPRPSSDNLSLYAQVDRYSFPSGHSCRMACLATITFLFFPKVGLFFFFWALFVGFARIHMRIHYFLDVTFGALIGVFTALLIYLFSPKIAVIFDFIIYNVFRYF